MKIEWTIRGTQAVDIISDHIIQSYLLPISSARIVSHPAFATEHIHERILTDMYNHFTENLQKCEPALLGASPGGAAMPPTTNRGFDIPAMLPIVHAAD